MGFQPSDNALEGEWQFQLQQDEAEIGVFSYGDAQQGYSSSGGINPFLNSISSLFMERNYLKVYDSRYLTLVTGRR